MCLATCAKDLKLYVWPSLSLSASYETPEDCVAIKSLSWSNNGKSLLVVKNNEHPVILQFPNQGEKKLEPSLILKNISAKVGCFANSSSTSIAFGQQDGSVFIYDLRKRRKINEYESVGGCINLLDFSFEDTCLAAGCPNGGIVLYTSNRQPCASYAVPYSHSLSAMSFNKVQPDKLAAASKEAVMAVWNTANAVALLTGRDHTGTITDLDFSGENVTTVGADGKFIVYDLRSEGYVSWNNLNTPISGVEFLQNSFDVAIGTSDGQLRSYDRRYMNSPLNSVVAYDSPVRKIKFQPLSTASPVSSRPTTKGTDFVFEGPPPKTSLPSAGDFSPCSSTVTSIKDVENIYLHEMLPPSASQIDVGRQGLSPDEASQFANEMGEFLKQHKRRTEDKMLAEFYQLRIEMSKQFIELHDKITKSWDGFVQYLKVTTQEDDTDNWSEAQTFNHSSDINSNKTKRSKKKM